MRPDCIFSSTIIAILLAAGPAMAQPADRKQALRDQVLNVNTAREAGKAYEEYFRELGPAGLRDAIADKDTGIALHAAWETNKKAVKRAKPIGRSDDIYDSEELAKFRTFLNERTKAPIPGWWSSAIVDIDLFPGRHHACYLCDIYRGDLSETFQLVNSKAKFVVPKGAELERVGELLRYSDGGRSVEFPGATFDAQFNSCYTGCLGEKRLTIAAYSTSGFNFKLAGFAGKGGKPVWLTEVWGSGRTILAGFGVHRVELTEHDGTIFVFGAESHGIYLEAFDATTGKCQYRFCSGYWFHFAEAWKR